MTNFPTLHAIFYVINEKILPACSFIRVCSFIKQVRVHLQRFDVYFYFFHFDGILFHLKKQNFRTAIQIYVKGKQQCNGAAMALMDT
jgi:hypothetical protein